MVVQGCISSGAPPPSPSRTYRRYALPRRQTNTNTRGSGAEFKTHAGGCRARIAGAMAGSEHRRGDGQSQEQRHGCRKSDQNQPTREGAHKRMNGVKRARYTRLQAPLCPATVEDDANLNRAPVLLLL